MEYELEVNDKLAGLLNHYGVQTQLDDEFVRTDLPVKVMFKARAVYHEVRNAFSSCLDVMALTGEGYQIIESFGPAPSCANFDLDRSVNLR